MALTALLATYLGRIVLAAVIWFAGRKLIGLVDVLERRWEKTQIDTTLHSF